MAEGMSTGARVVIGAAVMVFLIAVAVVGLGFIAQAWLEDLTEDMRGRLPEIQAQAVAFGADHTAAECIEEGVRRASGCSDVAVACQIETSLFAHSCLGAAPADPATCASVPPADDDLAIGMWALEVCEARDLAGAQWCIQLMKQGVARHCADARK